MKNTKTKMIFLSHVLAENLPVYGGRTNVSLRPVKSLDSGDSCNICEIKVQNHWGTHVDAPAHFFKRGLKAGDYPADFWHFVAPFVVRVKIRPSEIIEPGEWIKRIPKNTDLILFRSGWSQKRGTDDYTNRNPGLAPEVGYALRGQFANLRAVGMDWISVSAYEKREIGRKAHQAFLDPKGRGRPLLLIEDMDLSDPLEQLQEVWVVPLRIEGMDSAPCTVIGVLS